MKSYLLLFYASMSTLCTYFATRNNKGSGLYFKFPEKYLINNPLILNYLFNPENRVPKWFFIWHILSLLYFLIVLLIYVLYWLNISRLIESYLCLLIYMILLLTTTFTCFTIHWIYHKKYIF